MLIYSQNSRYERSVAIRHVDYKTNSGLPRRYAPRKDDLTSVSLARIHRQPLLFRWKRCAFSTLQITRKFIMLRNTNK